MYQAAHAVWLQPGVSRYASTQLPDPLPLVSVNTAILSIQQ
jgi:hypothetical protein